MILITSSRDNNSEYQRRLTEYYKIRSLVFAERLKWILKPEDGLDKDQFDGADTLYLLSIDPKIGTIGGVRLRPTLVDTMILNVFSDLFESPKFIPQST